MFWCDFICILVLFKVFVILFGFFVMVFRLLFDFNFCLVVTIECAFRLYGCLLGLGVV